MSPGPAPLPPPNQWPNRPIDITPDEPEPQDEPRQPWLTPGRRIWFLGTCGTAMASAGAFIAWSWPAFCFVWAAYLIAWAGARTLAEVVAAREALNRDNG